MADTIKRLARMACLVTTLACMTGIAMGQTRVEPEQPRWGQTLTIIYDPAAKGAKFSLADEVYLSAHLSFAGRSEGMVVKMKKDGSVFRYELALKTDLAVIQIAFVRLPDGLDPEARKNVMVYRPDGVPARGANLLNAFSNEYKKWVEKELTLYPDNYAAYHMKWQMAGVVDRDKVKEIVAADIDKLTREVKGEPANLLYSLSYGHLLLNHEEKSLEFLRRLVTQFPDAEYTGRALSDYAYEAYSRKFTGEGPNAVRGFVVELARQRPETDFARDKSGELANEKDAPLEVIEAICQKWIEAEPDNPHPYFNLATSYSTHKYKHEQTASLVDKAIDLTLQGKALLYGDLSIKSSEYRLVSAYKIKAEAALDQKQYGEAIAAVKAAQALQADTSAALYLLEARIWEYLSFTARAESALLQAWRTGSDEAENRLKAIYQRTHGGLDGFESYLGAKRSEMAAAGSGKKNLPSFKVTALNGQQFDLAALRGKVVVLNFWFIGCAPCRSEIPDLNKLVAEFKDKNVVFLAMAMDKQDELRKFLKEIPFDYQVIPEAGAFIVTQMGISAFPTHIIVGPEGQIEATFRGAGEKRPQELRLLISRLLGGK